MCDYIIVTISMDGLLQKGLMWFISVFFSYKSVYILQKKKKERKEVPVAFSWSWTGNSTHGIY